MRKRRNLIVALILVATMVMGIGYAALSTTLTINGTANSAITPAGDQPQDSNLDVLFTSGEATSAELTKVGSADRYTPTASTVASASVDGSNKLIASYTIGGDGHTEKLTREGDKVVFTYIITNRSADVDAKLNSIVLGNGGTLKGADDQEITNGATDYFKRTVKITDGTNTYTIDDDDVTSGTAGNVVIPKGNKTATVTVTVELIKTLGVEGNNDEKIALTDAKILFTFDGVVNP